jgi:hypothetical protein
VCDSDGKPDFKALMYGATGDLCAWCFDLLQHNGRGLRRRTLIRAQNHASPSAQQGRRSCVALLRDIPRPGEAARRGREPGARCIVSKLSYQPYPSGKNPGWIRSSAAPGARRTATAGRCLRSGDFLDPSGSWPCASGGVNRAPSHFLKSLAHSMRNGEKKVDSDPR